MGKCTAERGDGHYCPPDDLAEITLCPPGVGRAGSRSGERGKASSSQCCGALCLLVVPSCPLLCELCVSSLCISSRNGSTVE